MTITLTDAEYLSFVALARDQLREDTNKTLQLEELLRSIDVRNNIKRYVLKVRWEDLAARPPAYSKELIDSYPAASEGTIARSDRPLGKEDVDAYLKEKAKRLGAAFVTRDVAGRVGWTKLSEFFT